MRQLSLLVIAAAILVSAGRVRGQGPQPQIPAFQPATTVQLPTFSVFTVQTTVSVPDGGGSYLGGLSQGASGSNSRGFGPLRNRASGSSRAASGVSVSATIIDHEEIDRAILAAAAARRGEAVDTSVSKASDLSKSIARSDSGSALPDSLAAIRERNKAAADEKAKELADQFAKARQAEADGKTAVAKVYYQMVARKGAGQLKQQAEERLAALTRVSRN